MHYTKALNFNPTSHIIYTNRATAFKKHKEFQLMYDDSEKAIDLNDTYFKAFLRSGEAAVELGKMTKQQNLDMIEKGLKHL